ncbi:MAG: hypothetical protein ACXWDN_01400 [Limisphaerales bacterium]
MALKFKYQKREEIPAELLGHYAERDDAWQLDTDGVADNVLAHGHDALKARLPDLIVVKGSTAEGESISCGGTGSLEENCGLEKGLQCFCHFCEQATVVLEPL